MRRRVLVVLAAAAVLRLGAQDAALAADPRFPAWPCNQLKVPSISVPAVWTGPSIDDVHDSWETDPKARELVVQLAARRTSIDDAQKIITEFLTGGAAEKQDKAKRLFAGLFDTLNRQRSDVMRGIERFTRKQTELAGRIRSDALELRTLQGASGHDQSKLNEVANQIAWSTRIFEDRRRTINYVCEVPAIIEQRLFALGRAIQQSLD